MPSLAASLLVGLTAMAAVVPGAQGPSPRSTPPTSATPFGTNDAAARRLTVDGTAIYYEVYGEGSPVLLLHGGLYGYIAEYGPYIVELAKRHTVIAVATRGHGRSDVGSCRTHMTGSPRTHSPCCAARPAKPRWSSGSATARRPRIAWRRVIRTPSGSS